MKTQRNFWPLGILGAFVLFVGGMAGVVVIAATHRDHLVASDYYEQELKFQGQIDAAARAEKSGAKIMRDAAIGQIVITLPAAQLANSFSGTVELYRPAAPELDRAFPLQPRADGVQTLDASRLAAGPWQVRVRWQTGGQDYFLEQKITL
jgi:hypothetical protein